MKPWERNYAAPAAEEAPAQKPWERNFKAPAAEIGKAESAGAGLLQGGTFGFADEISGAAKGAYRRARYGGTLRDQYANARDESRRYFEEAKAANPASYTSGEVAGAVGSAFIPIAGQIGKGAQAASLAGRMATAGKIGAQVGAAQGAGYSEGESVADVILDTAKGGATGAAVGGALPVAGTVLRKGAEKTLMAGGAIKELGSSAASLAGRASPKLERLMRDAATPQGNLTAAGGHLLAGDLAGASTWAALGGGRLAYQALRGKPAAVTAPTQSAVPGITTRQEAEMVRKMAEQQRADAIAANLLRRSRQ